MAAQKAAKKGNYSAFCVFFSPHTLRSETFADQPIREIFTFRGNKLSRTEKN